MLYTILYYIILYYTIHILISQPCATKKSAIILMESIVQWRRDSDVEAPSRTLSNPGRAAPVVQFESTHILW